LNDLCIYLKIIICFRYNYKCVSCDFQILKATFIFFNDNNNIVFNLVFSFGQVT